MPETSRDVVVVLLDDTTFTVPVKVRLPLLYVYITSPWQQMDGSFHALHGFLSYPIPSSILPSLPLSVYKTLVLPECQIHNCRPTYYSKRLLSHFLSFRHQNNVSVRARIFSLYSAISYVAVCLYKVVFSNLTWPQLFQHNNTFFKYTYLHTMIIYI
jgi:hypothetical protein